MTYIEQLDKDLALRKKSRDRILKLKCGTLYECKLYGRDKVLGYFNKKDISTFTNGSYEIGIIPIATKYYEEDYGGYSVLTVDPLNMKEVKKEDLPLYVNWETTRKFKELLKGKK